jgi:diguanylate cyclase (GGDEF)-like protein/PAS domain S-box-containing protein
MSEHTHLNDPRAPQPAAEAATGSLSPGLAQRTLRDLADGMLITDAQGTILFVNAAFERITGYCAADALGHTPALLSSGLHDVQFYRSLYQTLAKAGHWSGLIWNRRKDGSVYPEWLSITGLRGPDGEVTHYAGVFSDLSGLEDMREQLHRLTFFDPVTGLANRRLFMDRLGRRISAGERIGVLHLNLDRFHLINDGLGHQAGDQLLAAVGGRIAACIARDMTLARMQGDELAVLVSAADRREPCAVLAGRILRALRSPFEWQGERYRIAASIGIACHPEDAASAETLVARARAATALAKRQGGNTYCLYRQVERSPGRPPTGRLDLENALREAIEEDSLDLWFQPQVELSHGHIHGVESLLRWPHPQLGLISPAQFLPLAEETDLIGEVGRWVLRRACATLVDWKAQGVAGVRMAINLSPRQFRDPGLPGEMALVLAEHHLAPEDVELEITESTAMPDLDYSIELLGELRDLGVGVALDDFGTGFSSLLQLKRLPITCLKLDQGFVRGIARMPADAAIAAMIIRLARLLGLEVVAEGVEEEQQLALLRRQGCDRAQGYLFARPMPADQILELLLAKARLGPPEA